MFKTKCKKTVSKMILSFILITLTLLSGCQKNTTHSAIEFGTIDVSEIDKIELSGTTGGKDGNFSYTLSDQEKKEFVHLLNQVELGDEVDKNQALSSGAVTYYKLYFQGKDVVTLCPGHYFGVDEKSEATHCSLLPEMTQQKSHSASARTQTQVLPQTGVLFSFH